MAHLISNRRSKTAKVQVRHDHDFFSDYAPKFIQAVFTSVYLSSANSDLS